MTSTLLKMSHISKSYPGVNAVDDVDPGNDVLQISVSVIDKYA